MTLIIKRKCTLERMNSAISNPTFAAVACIGLVLGVVSISGIIKNPRKINEVVELIQHKVHLGSVMHVDYFPAR